MPLKTESPPVAHRPRCPLGSPSWPPIPPDVAETVRPRNSIRVYLSATTGRWHARLGYGPAAIEMRAPTPDIAVRRLMVVAADLGHEWDRSPTLFDYGAERG